LAKREKGHFKNSIVGNIRSIYLQPMMRNAYEKKNGNLTESEAKDLLESCLKVLFYRDARSWNSVSVILIFLNTTYHSFC